MKDFLHTSSTDDTYWRAIVLFGQNTTSYKFALARRLLGFAAEGRTFVTLRKLAVPFAQHTVRHLQLEDRQGTVTESLFLESGRQFIRGDLSEDAFYDITTGTAFRYVLNVFHRLTGGESAVRFYANERKQRRGLVLTDTLHGLYASGMAGNLGKPAGGWWKAPGVWA